MEVIKRKILLEDSINRAYSATTYGQLTATSFYIKIFITQDVDNMGMFTDMSYIQNNGINAAPDYSILIDKLVSSGITFPFMSGITPTTVASDYESVLRLTGTTESDYYEFGQSIVTGMTDSKLSDTQSYIKNNPFVQGFITNETIYTNYQGNSVDGISTITATGDPITYIFDTDYYDLNLGTPLQANGLLYNDYSGDTREVINNGVSSIIPVTTFSYHGEGWNQTNTSLSALTKEEYLFGVISPPEVQSDVFIDRGTTSVLEKHLKLAEVITIDELVRYGNGFYNVNKQ